MSDLARNSFSMERKYVPLRTYICTQSLVLIMKILLAITQTLVCALVFMAIPNGFQQTLFH